MKTSNQDLIRSFHIKRCGHTQIDNDQHLNI